jgi:hypothetical protein
VSKAAAILYPLQTYGPYACLGRLGVPRPNDTGPEGLRPSGQPLRWRTCRQCSGYGHPCIEKATRAPAEKVLPLGTRACERLIENKADWPYLSNNVRTMLLVVLFSDG